MFLAVVRAGTVRAAAATMKVDASTVSRRIAALEQSAGVRLFHRTSAGLPGSFTALVHRAVAPFVRRHPETELELLTLDALVDIDGRQTDVAIRVAARPPEHLVGRRVAALAAAVYASHGYLLANDAPLESPRHVWIDWDRRLASKPAFAWLQQRVPERRIVARGLSTADVLCGVVAGTGVGALPCIVGDAEPSLVRLLDAPQEAWSSVWLLTHADLKPAARVRTVIAHLTAELRAERPRIEGVTMELGLTPGAEQRGR